MLEVPAKTRSRPTVVRKDEFPLPWSTVGETALAKGFCSNMGGGGGGGGDTMDPCICRRTKLPGRGIHSQKIGRHRQGMSQRRSCDRQLTVCSLFWLGPVSNKELVEEIAHNHVCVL